MSRVGKLSRPLTILKVSSEVSALERLKQVYDFGIKANYIRHSRTDFSVVLQGGTK